MTVNVEDLPDISFSFWCHLAKLRPHIMLRDKRIGVLISVDSESYTAKIKMGNRHYIIEYDDMWAFKVKDPIDESLSSWTMLPSWSVSERPVMKSCELIEHVSVVELPPRVCYGTRRSAIQGLGASFQESF